MNLIEMRDEFNKLIEQGFGNCEVNCSVDMSIEGNEDTYVNRVFGEDAFLVRVHHFMDGYKTIVKSEIQILFKKGEINYDSTGTLR